MGHRENMSEKSTGTGMWLRRRAETSPINPPESKRKRIFGRTAFFLALLLALTACADTVTVKPGQAFTAGFLIEGNPDQVIYIKYSLEYDHQVFAPDPSAGIQNDIGLLSKTNPFENGEVITVPFRALEDVPAGDYQISMHVMEAVKADFSMTDSLPIQTLEVHIGKKKYENEYYSNGEIKVEYEFNSDGFVSRINYYNRYGCVTRYEIPEKWDSDGNILQDMEYYPGRSDAYSVYQNTYAYDKRGNVIRSSFVRKDGTAGSITESEYDDNDHVLWRMQKDSGGKVLSIHRNHQYDADDHLIGYESFNENDEPDGSYRAVFENGVRTESTTTDAEGNITDRYTYDPVYGDELSWQYGSGGSYRYEEIYTYSDTYYETDWKSLFYGDRQVTRYNRDGTFVKTDGYVLDKASGEWVYDYTTEHDKNAAGNTVERTRYADGSVCERELDSNGRMILSTRTKEDGSFWYAYSYEYDAEGHEIRSNSFREDGSIDSYSLSEYDQNGYEKTHKTYEANGQYCYGFSYEYDSEGRTVRSSQISEDGTVKSYTVYEYDEKGQTTRDTSYRADGSVNSFTEYEQGERSHYIYYRDNGNKWSETFYRTLPDGTRQSKETTYNDDGSVKEEGDWENQ